MVNLSKEGLLSRCKRWSRIELSLDGFAFLKVSGDFIIYSSDLTFKCFSVKAYQKELHLPHVYL